MMTLPFWLSTEQAFRLKAALEAEGFEKVSIGKGPFGGEIVVTAGVRDQLTAGLDGDVEDLGECHLKHVKEPVRASLGSAWLKPRW